MLLIMGLFGQHSSPAMLTDLHLLLQVSDEAERSVLVKLKTECGYQFTSKLESMFTDIKTSRDTMQEYKARRQASANGEDDVELAVQVCSTCGNPASFECAEAAGERLQHKLRIWQSRVLISRKLQLSFGAIRAADDRKPHNRCHMLRAPQASTCVKERRQ